MTYWALNAIFLGVVLVALIAAAILGRGRRARSRPGAGRPNGDALNRNTLNRNTLNRDTLSWPALGITLAVLLVMTAVFDNVMIGIGLVAYNEALISGAFIGIAPLEDFAYAVAAVVGLPSLWVLLGRRPGRPSDHA